MARARARSAARRSVAPGTRARCAARLRAERQHLRLRVGDERMEPRDGGEAREPVVGGAVRDEYVDNGRVIDILSVADLAQQRNLLNLRLQSPGLLFGQHRRSLRLFLGQLGLHLGMASLKRFKIILELILLDAHCIQLALDRVLLIA